jgi:hypothetical protein
MHRSYNVRITALTLGVTAKWVDNVMSHYSVLGVEHGTRGIERKVGDDTLLALAICRILSSELGVPLANAVSIANRVASSRREALGNFEAAAGLKLQFSLDDIERRIRSRLPDAIESAAHVRRGRPRRSSSE